MEKAGRIGERERSWYLCRGHCTVNGGIGCECVWVGEWGLGLGDYYAMMSAKQHVRSGLRCIFGPFNMRHGGNDDETAGVQYCADPDRAEAGSGGPVAVANLPRPVATRQPCRLADDSASAGSARVRDQGCGRSYFRNQNHLGSRAEAKLQLKRRKSMHAGRPSLLPHHPPPSSLPAGRPRALTTQAKPLHKLHPRLAL